MRKGSTVSQGNIENVLQILQARARLPQSGTQPGRISSIPTRSAAPHRWLRLSAMSPAQQATLKVPQAQKRLGSSGGDELRHQSNASFALLKTSTCKGVRPGLLNSSLAKMLNIFVLMQEHLTDLRMLCVIRALRDEEVNEAFICSIMQSRL